MNAITWEPVRSEGPRHHYYPTTVARTRVPGGWLVFAASGGVAEQGGLAFVPDPEHAWLAEEAPTGNVRDGPPQQ